jgi:hypothetical protein
MSSLMRAIVSHIIIVVVVVVVVIIIIIDFIVIITLSESKIAPAPNNRTVQA